MIYIAFDSDQSPGMLKAETVKSDVENHKLGLRSGTGKGIGREKEIGTDQGGSQIGSCSTEGIVDIFTNLREIQFVF